MTTKYDCFEIVYKNKSLLNAKDVAKHFPRENYATIYKQLSELVKENLIEKKDSGFQALDSKKTELLFLIIEHCLRNQINYNQLIDKNIVKFIKYALEKKEITAKNSKINSRTLKKYISILEKNELGLVISEKPLRFKIFYNALLNNLLLFFDFNKINLNKDKISYIREIEKEIEKFKRLRKQNEAKYKQILEELEIPFVYHSLSIEGNPVTLLNTQKILKNKILPADLRNIDVEEIKNYREAINKMLRDVEEDKELTIPLILEYHKISMKQISLLSGQIRTSPVHIKGNPDFKVSSSENIISDLEKLIPEYQKFINKKESSIKEIINFAIEFHNSFQHIHPFEDGNSRTTRLIVFHIFQKKNIPIFDIPYGLLNEYISNTKGSKQRNDEKLKETFQKIILSNLKKIIGRLK
jgi:Fic family protein